MRNKTFKQALKGLCLLTAFWLCAGTAWAGGGGNSETTYYLKAKAEIATGAGTVYATDNQNTKTSATYTDTPSATSTPSAKTIYFIAEEDNSHFLGWKTSNDRNAAYTNTSATLFESLSYSTNDNTTTRYAFFTAALVDVGRGTGTVSCSNNYTNINDHITISATPGNGYLFAGWRVLDGNGDEMPGEIANTATATYTIRTKCTILADFEKAPDNSLHFVASCLNVDGLPQSFLGVEVNKDGPGSAGSKKISQKFAEKGWDIIGVSEDFEYHSDIVSAIKNDYYIGTHRGSVGVGQVMGSVADTDGLGIFTKKSTTTTSGEHWEEWDIHVGDINNGADGLIKKGFRYYCVQFEDNLSVDVYVLHMNSESTQVAINAKHDEIRQLVAYIKAHNNGRPIIVMGDTNCRYTREELQARFIDVLNDDPDYYIKDAWVELERMGFYPSCGSMTVDDEVVDKIFYINNRQSGMMLQANSYLHDQSFVDENGKQLSDHKPVVVDFSIKHHEYDLSQPIGPETAAAGELNGTYYFRNVGTGKYLAQGSAWGTLPVVDEVGVPMEITALPNGGYQLHAPSGYINFNDLWMDRAEVEFQSHPWIFAKASATSYTFGPSAGTYTGVGNLVTGRVINMAFPTEHQLYAWELVTQEQREAELVNATLVTPMDASFLIPGAKMYRNNPYSKWPATGTGSALIYDTDNGVSGDENDPGDAFMRLRNSSTTTNNAGTVTQTVNNLRPGKYVFSCHAFSTSSSSIKFTVNGTQLAVPTAPTSLGKDLYESTVANELAKDNYKLELELTNPGSLTIQIVKNNLSRQESTTCFNDFKLIYYGPAVQSMADLKDVYSELLDEANALKNEKMANTAKTALENAIVPVNTLTTQEAIINAANTLRSAMDTAKASVAKYRVYKSAINHMYELMASTNVYTQAAYNTYKAKADNYLAQYEAGTLETDVVDPSVNNGWHVDVDYAPFLYSAFGDNHSWDNGLYINSWSIESASDGSNFGLPFFEYWYAQEGGQCLPARTFTATLPGLEPNQIYILTAYARAATLNGADIPAGITMQAGNGTPVDITKGKPVETNFERYHYYLGTFSAVGTTDESGNLQIVFNVEEGTTIHWVAFKNLMVTKPLPGDVNNDGEVTLSDVPAFIDLRANGNNGSYNVINADNLNGNTDAEKVETLVNKLCEE